MLKLRFYLSMLSVMVVDAAITLAYALLHDRDTAADIAAVQGLDGDGPGALWLAGLANVLILGGVNLVGSWLLFRPVARWLDGRGDAQAARRTIARLPLHATAWAAAVALLYGMTVFRLGVFTPEGIGAADLQVRVAMFVWFLFVYATYMCFVVYFAVTDLAASLRERWTAETGQIIPPRQGRLVFRLIVVFAVVTVMPVALVLIDLSFFQEVRRLQGLGLEETVFLDLFGALAAAALSLIFVTRSVVRPIESLVAGLGRVGAGDLPGRMAVTTDDELGVLTRAFNRMVDGLRERAFVRETFGKYVPAAVADRILGEQGGLDGTLGPGREDGRLTGDTVHATVMFVDLERFTRLAEALSPEAVLDLLNEYLAAIADPIERHGGVINAFIGDAVLVTFNLPAADPEHADRAVACARDILDLLAERRFAGDIALGARIGINTGPVVAGSVGPSDRLAFTVLGDTVNLAARLEGLNRDHGTRVLLGEATRQACRRSWPFVDVGTVPVKGREEPASVWGLAAGSDPVTDAPPAGVQPRDTPPEDGQAADAQGEDAPPRNAPSADASPAAASPAAASPTDGHRAGDA
ncbi:MAG: HAMP domain-containing protein [Deinococcus-Thermus bacterium]|jgi:class 3 adenylate cyclase|nr:HAMP domain-containing protein [Deinococcota bacterium]